MAIDTMKVTNSCRGMVCMEHLLRCRVRPCGSCFNLVGFFLPLEHELPFDHTWNILPRGHGQLAVVGLDDEPRERHNRLYRAHVSCMDVM
jgi:hypothetical protein